MTRPLLYICSLLSIHNLKKCSQTILAYSDTLNSPRALSTLWILQLIVILWYKVIRGNDELWIMTKILLVLLISLYLQPDAVFIIGVCIYTYSHRAWTITKKWNKIFYQFTTGSHYCLRHNSVLKRFYHPKQGQLQSTSFKIDRFCQTVVS